jgi:hypothetical protein
METSYPLESRILSLRVREITILFGALLFLCIPAFLGRDAIGTVSLLPISGANNPYILPQYAGLLYIWAPLVIISTLILFLSPGLLFVLLFNKAKSFGQWLAYGLVSSIILVSFSAALIQGLIKTPLRGPDFGLVVVLCAFVCYVILAIRVRRGMAVQIPSPFVSPILLSFFFIWILVAALSPKFYWENFNGDGAHAFEAARLLLFQPFPFWDSSAGEVASFPGVSSMLFAYPASWFIRFFGEFEASSRLPYLLYLVCTFGIIQSLGEHGQNRKLGLIQQSLLWLGLIVYTLTIAYSATYSPYSADISLPATQDTLVMVCFLGFVYAYISDDRLWMVLFQLMTLFSLPNGLLLVGMWVVCVVLVFRPISWRKLILIVVGFVIFFAISFVMPRLMLLLNQPFSKDEYGLISLLSRFAFLQFTDIRRFLFVIVPAGILPALSLALWKKQDQLAKALTLLTIFYFGFFYIQAYTALHYFIPVMLIPLVVFWRYAINLPEMHQRWISLAVTLAGIGAIVLSLPTTFSVDRSGRTVGMTIDNRIQGYDTLNPAVYRSMELLYHLFPYDWDPEVPNVSYGGSALVWSYYAQQGKGLDPSINYVIQDIHEESQEGMRLMASNSEFALYIRDAQVLTDQRALRPDTPAGSPLYAIPRSYLFRSVAESDGTAVISVLDLLRSAGFDLTPLLNKFGIEYSS